MHAEQVARQYNAELPVRTHHTEHVAQVQTPSVSARNNLSYSNAADSVAEV